MCDHTVSCSRSWWWVVVMVVMVVIGRVSRDNKMHGRQASDEWLYMRRENGGRGLKSMKDLYEETKVRVAWYMTHSENAWIKTAWRREFQKEGKSIKNEAEDALREKSEKCSILLGSCKNTRHSTGRRLEENLEKKLKRKSWKGEKNYELKIIRARICKASITKDLTCG